MRRPPGAPVVWLVLLDLIARSPPLRCSFLHFRRVRFARPWLVLFFLLLVTLTPPFARIALFARVFDGLHKFLTYTLEGNITVRDLFRPNGRALADDDENNLHHEQDDA